MTSVDNRAYNRPLLFSSPLKFTKVYTLLSLAGAFGFYLWFLALYDDDLGNPVNKLPVYSCSLSPLLVLHERLPRGNRCPDVQRGMRISAGDPVDWRNKCRSNQPVRS
jgi:hypothetical protein